MPHTIRLRGPWGCEPLARFRPSGRHPLEETTDDLPPPGRLTMPADWSGVCGGDYRGRVRFRRRFHWPARLLASEEVWLVFSEVRGQAQAVLNHQPLGTLPRSGPAEYQVTQQLEPTNVLEVEVAHPFPPDTATHEPAAAGGLVGEVRLEVRMRS